MRRAGLALAGLVLVAGCGATTPAEPTPPLAPPAAPVITAPVSVTIPALDVTDDVVPVGLCKTRNPPGCPTGTGEMELPDVHETGFYELGPKPGEQGRAVLASHVDWEGVPGAFKHLPRVKVGDTVTTKAADGRETTFVVYASREIKKADYANVTVPLVFGPTTDRELAVVTCAGTVSNGSYDSNWVLLARLVTS